MKRKYITTTAALMLLTAALTYCITLYSAERDYNSKLMDLSAREKEYSKIAEVRSYIDKYFVNDFSEQEMTDGAVAGMILSLGDKWSYYLTAEQFKSVQNSVNNKLVGIGINATFDTENDSVAVLNVYENSPAEYAGLKPGDRIVSVDGVSVASIGFEAAVNKMKGVAGTSVSISVIHAGSPNAVNLSITRREIDIEGVHARILDGNIGYIEIANFDANIDGDFLAALENLKKANVKGIIFDVRNNPGGMLQVLVNTLDPLLPEGIIISEEDKNGEKKMYESDKNELNIPMAVLINEYSISAAEFFAAALQEAGKATLVGEATTGKGCAQSQIKLSDGSGLVLSVSKYFTGRGTSLEDTRGIKPDREVKLTNEEKSKFYLLSDAQDRQLQAAIAVINEKTAQ